MLKLQSHKAGEMHTEKIPIPTDESSTTDISQPTVGEQGAPKNVVLVKQEPKKVSLRQRLRHFTFAWFLTTMSTGGLALALAETPHRFTGLHTIGLIIFFLNFTLFMMFCTLMLARCVLYPRHVKKAIFHPAESFFIGSFWLSISVILGGIQVYGITYGPGWTWLVDAVYVLYWLYAGFSLANAIAQYYILILRSAVRPVPFTPPMFLAGYSAMLTGTIASLIAGTQPPHRAVLVILSGLAFKGFGFMISFICIGYFVRLLLDKGLPPPQLRAGLFIPVGSVAYTAVTLMGLADTIPDGYGYFAQHPTAKETLKIMALFISVFMWLFAFWIFAIAFLANVTVVGGMPFTLSWWAFIFPNVGFMLCTSMIGKELDSAVILWCASAMTIGVVVVWLVAFVGCVRATWTSKIVWPGRDEDKDL